MSRTLGALRRRRTETMGIAAFTAVALLVTSLIAGTLIGGSGATETYRAEFRNASGLKAGDDVRISGVRVGKVESVDLEGTHAVVEFAVARDQVVYEQTTATIDFLNLLGQRYVHLEAPSHGGVLAPGATIPMDHTSEGLDLTAVFNAFKPLFEMIKPEDVNQLANEIVQALQGQGPTLRHLMSQTAALTTTLVDRDEVIGSVIDNLTVVMETMQDHRTEFRSMIHELNSLAGVVAQNRDQIGATIDGVQRMTTSFASLLASGGDSIVRDVDSLARWSASFSSVAPKIAAGLKDTQTLLLGYIKTLGMGSFLNTYVCKSSVQVAGAPKVNLSTGNASSWRCK